MYCSNCGLQINDNAVICIKCGVATKNLNSASQLYPQVAPAGSHDWLTTLLLCFFLGCFGVHSFYTKKTVIGILQLITLGGCGIWQIIDFIMIATGSFRDGNGNPLHRQQ